MQKAIFKELCICIRRAWTPKDGVIIRLLKSPDSDSEMLLCVGGHRNPALCARYSVVWDDDRKLYDGEIESASLQHMLTKKGICYAEITNARLMEHDRRGVFKCLKDPAACQRSCSMHKTVNLEVEKGLSVAFA